MKVTLFILTALAFFGGFQLVRGDDDPTGGLPQNYVQLFNLIIGKINGLWNSGTFNILGHNCTYNTKPGFHRWQLEHRTKLTCPPWTLIEGSGTGKSADGSVKKAVADFLKKAKEAGLLTDEQVETIIKTGGIN